MRDIINLQIGGAGNAFGAAYWKQLCEEHRIDGGGHYHGEDRDFDLAKASVYFQEEDGETFRPRAILMDLDAGSVDQIRDGDQRDLFDFEYAVTGDGPSDYDGGNYARGAYRNGHDKLDQCMDAVRHAIEQSHSFQGFQVMHGLGGGTGSGMGCKLIERLREDYCGKTMASFAVVPSPEVAPDFAFEPYNAVLAINQLVENADQVFWIDNQAVHHINVEVNGNPEPNYTDLNHTIASAMAGVTSGYRFPGTNLNENMAKLSADMVLFPRLHFFMTGFCPQTRFESEAPDCSVHELADRMLDENCWLTAGNPREGKFLTASAMFRGRHDWMEVDEAMLRTREERDCFVEWVPNNLKHGICEVGPLASPMSVSYVANSTAIKHSLCRLYDQFNEKFRHKQFLDRYIENGCEEQEMVDAMTNMSDLQAEYEQYEDAGEG